MNYLNRARQCPTAFRAVVWALDGPTAFRAVVLLANLAVPEKPAARPPPNFPPRIYTTDLPLWAWTALTSATRH